MKHLSLDTKTALATLLLVSAGGLLSFHFLGYTLANGVMDGVRLGRTLASNGGSVRNCLKIKTFIPTYPPLGQIQSSCILEYAKASKDPTACELLMPSDYGFSCLGAARESEPCGFYGSKNKEVRGNGMIEQVDNCINHSSEHSNNECCVLARILYGESATETCISFEEGSKFADQCYHYTGTRERSIELCNKAQNTNIRTSCEVAVRALLSESE